MYIVLVLNLTVVFLFYFIGNRKSFDKYTTIKNAIYNTNDVLYQKQEMQSRQEKWSSRKGSKTLTTDVILRGITVMMSRDI